MSAENLERVVTDSTFEIKLSKLKEKSSPIQSVLKKWYSQDFFFLDMIFVENVYVFGIILKRNYWSFCCF